ncbi:MAG: hypothetical protein PVI75_02795 [Gammaproteobacteria bacterium]|jgi:hypothetical protein
MDNMIKNIVLILFLIFNFFIVAFAGDVQIPKGKIIYAIGNDSIYVLDLKTLHEKVIHKEKAFLSGLSKIDSTTFLFTSDDVQNSCIKKYDLATNTIEKVTQGAKPTYAGKSKIYFYYAPSYKEGDWLYELNYAHNSKARKIIKSCAGGLCRRAIMVSKNQLLISNPEKRGELLLLDTNNNGVKFLPVKGCGFPLIWRSKANQLLCADVKNKDYFLIKLNGEDKKTINLGKYNNVSPILYIPETDQLIYSRLDGFLYGEHYDWWIYDFTTGEKKLLIKNAMGQAGDAIYLPNKD